VRYQTAASNRDGGSGISSVDGGLRVAVASPLDPERDPAASNPEQLLALAWATCLNATAQVIVADGRRTAVRVAVQLRDAEHAAGFEFEVDAYLSLEDAERGETESVLAAAHARCPVSRLLAESANVRVHAEAYEVS